MSAGKIIKCVFGLLVIIVLTTILPFFDNIPWNIPQHKKRAVVRQAIQNLAALPPLTEKQYFSLYENERRDSEQPLLHLRSVYPSPIPMIFREMKRDPRTRAWGLIAVMKCDPSPGLQDKYAPSLAPLVKWLQDPDSIVASNALGVLERYVVLPQEYLSGHNGKRPEHPSDWHTIYNQWLRTEEPDWHSIQCRYYGKKNWPRAGIE